MTHANTGFWRKYVFSTDHKTIAAWYFWTGIIMAVAGGVLAAVFRSQLAWPGKAVPLFGVLSPDTYNAYVTLHGTIMVFWVAMPILLGGFGNLLIPLMIGAKDMVFPRLNLLSYWLFFLSTVVLLASFFVPGGAAGLGWTVYPPLSARPDFTGVTWGGHLWILAVALEFVAMIMGGVNFLTTILNARAPGMTFWRLPLMIWMQAAASVIFLFSVGPLIAGALMLLLDRTAGTHFFLPQGGGDPLLFQHLFWFFGHPEVYVILLPGLGVLCEVLTANARRPFFGYKIVVWSTVVAGFLSFIVWAHHQFLSGMDPRLAMPFSITTILISVPFAVFLFSAIATLRDARPRWTTAFLFAVTVLAEFLLGGVTGILLGSAPADIYFHDTYYVVAHFHYTLFPSTIFAMLAGLYHWFPKMTGRVLSEGLGKAHWFFTTLFFNLTFLPMFLLGMHGHHRRIYNPELFDWLKPFQHLQEIATIGAIGLLAAQVLLLVNLVYAFLRKERAEANPWRASTLEWLAPSPPPHGNFSGAPQVVGGPYGYSGGKEFQSQGTVG